MAATFRSFISHKFTAADFTDFKRQFGARICKEGEGRWEGILSAELVNLRKPGFCWRGGGGQYFYSVVKENVALKAGDHGYEGKLS